MRTGSDSFESGQIDGAPRRRKPRRLSAVFQRVADRADGRVTVADILDALGDRSFAALLVLFGAFNLLPLPPGGSTVLGLPLIIVSAQLLYGSRRVWLPRFISRKSLSAEQFRALVARVVPRLQRLERLIRPRYWPFWRRRGDRVIGSIVFVLAVVLALPIPFGNWAPAFAIVLLGLSLSERDGILFAAGTVAAGASCAVAALVVGAAGAATHAALGWIF